MSLLLKRKLGVIITKNKMEPKNKKDGWKYLSVPALNKINNEVYVEDNRTLSDDNSRSSHSVNCILNKNLKKERRKSLMSIFSFSGSSINEKTGLSSWKPLDTEQRTWNSSFLFAHNDQANSSHFSNPFKNESSQINGNILSMTQAHSVSRGPTDPDGSAGAPLSTKNFEPSELIQSSRSSKARQKKFHRHFKQVDIEEKVLNYYSCALVGDILLQGHLYITENFFAFYSNVFGYVTKLLIPTVDVLKISKEKTARIIPNAVGISTEDEKHVFGSLLSRDSTYKFMLQVWKAANNTNLVVDIKPPPSALAFINRQHHLRKEVALQMNIKKQKKVLLQEIKTELPSDEDSSASSVNEEPSSYISNLKSPASSENLPKLLPSIKRKSILVTSMEVQNSKRSWNSHKVKSLLVVSLGLLVFLLGSAGFLLYRIAIIQNRFNDLAVSTKGSNIYEDIVKWQSAIHSKSADQISEFLNANLNQIIKVRLSLEALSMLILPGNKNMEKPYLDSKWKGSGVKKKDEEAEVGGD